MASRRRRCGRPPIDLLASQPSGQDITLTHLPTEHNPDLNSNLNDPGKIIAARGRHQDATLFRPSDSLAGWITVYTGWIDDG